MVTRGRVYYQVHVPDVCMRDTKIKTSETKRHKTYLYYNELLVHDYDYPSYCDGGLLTCYTKTMNHPGVKRGEKFLFNRSPF